MKRFLLPALLVGAFAFGSAGQADAYSAYYGGYYGYPTVIRYSSPHSYYYGRSNWDRYDRRDRYSRYRKYDRHDRWDRHDRYDRWDRRYRR